MNLLQHKDEEATKSTTKSPRTSPRKVNVPSDTANKGTLKPDVVIEIDPSDYTAELANKTRAMVIAIDNPDPNLEIKIDQHRPVVRTKQTTHTLLFLLLFGSPVWPVRERVNELKFKRHGLVQ